MAVLSRILLFSGPPFAASLFRRVLPRLLAAGVPAQAIAATDADAERVLAALGPETLAVAHGLAVPWLLTRAPAAVGGVVLSNGPVTRLSAPMAAVTSLLGRAPGPLAATLLRPTLSLGWLASSAGLRRAVNNPYAMDRDTVAALCGPLLGSAVARRATLDFVRSLPVLPAASVIDPTKISFVWGDSDALHPLAEVDALAAGGMTGPLVTLAGGRFAHPEEMPWMFADELLSIGRAGQVSAPDPGGRGSRAAEGAGHSGRGRGDRPAVRSSAAAARSATNVDRFGDSVVPARLLHESAGGDAGVARGQVHPRPAHRGGRPAWRPGAPNLIPRPAGK